MRTNNLALSLYVLFGFVFAGWVHGGDPLVSSKAIEASIQKGLPYVAERGDWWIEKKECMSCHRVAFTAWSHVEAHFAGVSVDEKQVNDWIDWCNENLFEPFPEKDQKYPGEQTIERNLSGAAQVLALARNWKSTEEQKEFHKKIIGKLKKGQQKDGKWNPKGQLPGQKRELTETSHVISLWNSLALIHAAELDHIEKDSVQGMIDAARKYVESYDEGKSSEWVALRALLASKLGQGRKDNAYLERLLKLQNSDGGFGWIAKDESDVLATSQVVYALLEIGLESDEKPVQLAAKYLVSMQKEDGSWKVKGTKTKAKGRFTETAGYWGSAWAIIALSKVNSKNLQTKQ